MRDLAKRVAVFVLAVAIIGPSITSKANAGLLHHEKSPAMRKHKAEKRARETEKKMKAKKHLFSHGN